MTKITNSAKPIKSDKTTEAIITAVCTFIFFRSPSLYRQRTARFCSISDHYGGIPCITSYRFG
jgi:hypothetical protein